MGLKVPTSTVTAFEQNASLVWCTASGEAAIIDPGGDAERIGGAVAAEGVRVRAVWLTHGHLDHELGARAIADRYAIPVIGPHCADGFWLERLPEQSV
ncbi:MAG: MBL fold metallo-hydrolase [Thioalkalivibrionaceae bacterium]